MEIILKITDADDASTAIQEAARTIQEDKKTIDTLLSKGRNKFDLIGEGCNLEFSVKDGQKPKEQKEQPAPKTELAGQTQPD